MILTRWTLVGKVMSLLLNMLSRLIITFLTQPLKKNAIMPFAATWTDLEIVILSEVKSDKEEKILYDIFLMLNLKRNDTNELTNLKQTHKFRE